MNQLKQIIKSKGLLGLCVLGMFAHESCSQVLLQIADEPVSVENFAYLYSKNYQNDPQAFTLESLESYLELFVNFKLKVHEAKLRGYAADPEFRSEFEQYRAQLIQPYLTDQRVLDSLVRQAYQRMQQEVRVSHLLLALPEGASAADTANVYAQMLALRTKAIHGEPFERLAMSHSADPSAKMNRGDLGYFSVLQMVYPFESAAYQLDLGEVSMPVRTQFGYHLLQITDRRPAKGAVKVAHIMVQSRPNAEPADTLAAYQKINYLYNKLREGASWQVVCQEYSDDLASKDKGGELNWFSAGMMNPDFAEAAFPLKVGEISAPVRTAYGWHLIRMLERKPVGSFEQERPELLEKVKRDSRAELAVNALLERLKSQEGFQQDDALLSQIFESFDESLLSGKWQPEQAVIPAESPIFRIGNREVMAQVFYDFIVRKERPVRIVEPQVYAGQLYMAFRKEWLMNYAAEALPRLNPEFAQLEQEYLEGLLLFKVMEEEVWNKAVEDTLGLRAFFEANRERYQWAERVKARIYEATDRKTLDSALQLLQAAHVPAAPEWVMTFEENANKWGEENTETIEQFTESLKADPTMLLQVSVLRSRKEPESINAKRISKVDAFLESRNIPESQRLPLLDLGRVKRKAGQPSGGELQFAFFLTGAKAVKQNFGGKIQVKEGEFEPTALPFKPYSMVPGLSVYQKGERALALEILEILPAGPKSFQQSRGLVIADYQQQLENAWVSDLRENYKLVIDQAVLESLVQP